MKPKYKALAFIPARGGSKRLPRKNLANLAGKPLVARTLEATIDSFCFEKIVLSTDDDEIANVGKSYPKVTIDDRPEYLATSNATALNTILEFMHRQTLGKFDIIAMLLPTCPFRDASDIRKGLSLLTREVDSVVSVTSYEFPYEMSLDGERNDIVTPFFKPSPLTTGNTRSQDQKEYFRPNGGFYISWWSSMLKYANFFKGKVRSYYMERIKSVDLDTEFDLKIAQLAYQNYISPDKNKKR